MSKKKCFVSSLLALCFLATGESSRILAVFPIPSISHQVVFRPLTQELAKRGHEVVVITPNPAFLKGKAPANLTEIDIHDLSYRSVPELQNLYAYGDTNDTESKMGNSNNFNSKIFEDQLHDEQVQRIIKDKGQHFDLLLLEACVGPALVFSHFFKAPVILVSSFGATYHNNDVMGIPTHPIIYPSVFRQKMFNFTVLDKVTELYNFMMEKATYASHKLSNEFMELNVDPVVPEHPEIPSLNELSKNVDMLFLNVHPIWDSNRPVPPNVIYMGGLHLKPAKELPKDLKTYLDASVNGVIYISFGSNVPTRTLSPEKVQTFIRVLSKLPYDVLWKWDEDDLPGRSQNIRISNWFPQSDLLRHPKVKLFITQGGLQSTDEAIEAGVPLIGIPMMGDQWYNVEQYVNHNIGFGLEMDAITEESLENAIKTVIGDVNYRRNVVRLRELMRDQPQPPLERAVWWTEHVLRHGGARHLRAPAANMAWREFLELNLTFFIYLVIGLLSSVTLLLLSASSACKYLMRTFNIDLKYRGSFIGVWMRNPNKKLD